jgi:hypothetical protein
LNANNKDDKSWFKSSSSSTNKYHQQQQEEEETVEQDGLVWEKWEISFKIHSIPNAYPASSPKNTGHHLLFNPIGYLSAKSDKSSGPSLPSPFISLGKQEACSLPSLPLDK